jgi:uncharacterized repeat protein (TIGR03803 family)
MKNIILFTVIAFTLVISPMCRAQQPILWGMTSSGGQSIGTLFNFKTATGSDTVVHNFGIGTDGSAPIGSLLKATNGLLYGMTPTGGTYYDIAGTIFSYNILTGKETDIHDFTGSLTDGYDPQGSLIQLSNGLLYGTATSGGTYNGGIIFSYNITSGVFTDLYNFGFAFDALQPGGTLLAVNDSVLYGTTYSGGLYSIGTIFSYNINTGTENVIHSFGNTNDGYRPTGALIRAGNGLLYGMTLGGGAANDSGTIFSYNIATGIETVLHNFGGGGDGTAPNGSLMQANDSLLYGLTADGGLYGGGTIFSYNITTGKETDLHDFGNGTDGFEPEGSLIQASNGLLYGTTVNGLGAALGGTIFSYDIASGKETDIYNFGSYYGDGTSPQGDLLEDDVSPLNIDLQCNGRDQHSIYLVDNLSNYYRIDSVDTHPTKPVYLGTDTLNAFGLSINKNLDTASSEMTMYMCDGSAEYYYRDNANWKDTHHRGGSVNPGGTNQYIFNLDETGGVVFRYDGTGNATQLANNLPTAAGAIWDVATDRNGNFYLFYTYEMKIIAYNPDGIPIDTFITKGTSRNVTGFGCTIVGSRFYFTDYSSPKQLLWEGILNGDTVNFSVVDTLLPFPFSCRDLASCPDAANQLAVFQVPEAPHFIIYPNPASNETTIKMDNTAVIEITDLTGRMIFTADTPGLTQYRLSLARYLPGMYIVTARSPDGLAGHTRLIVE